MLDVVGEGALLKDVPSLHKHLLEVEKELKQFLGRPRNKITEARYCTKFTTDFLNLRLALVYNLLQRHVTVGDLAKTENVTEVTKKDHRGKKFLRMFLEPLPLKFPNIIIKTGGDVASIRFLQPRYSCDLHADNKKVKGDNLEEVLLVLAEKH